MVKLGEMRERVLSCISNIVVIKGSVFIGEPVTFGSAMGGGVTFQKFSV